MKNFSLKNIVIVFLFLFSKFHLLASDLPSEFDDIINDNPTDAPIDFFIWQFVLMAIAIGYVMYYFYKKRYFYITKNNFIDKSKSS